MTSDEIANWVSGIGSLGAIVAALYGYWLIEKQRRSDRRDAEMATAYELLTVVLNIGNHLKAIQHHCADQRNDITVRSGRTSVTYKMMNPLIGLSGEGEIAITSGSTELLIKANQLPLWNDLQLLFARNRSLTMLMIEYRTLWQDLIDRTPTPFDFSGTIGRIETGQEGYLALRPKLVIIDRVVGDITDQANDTIQVLEGIIPKLGLAFEQYFGARFLRLKFASAAAGQHSGAASGEGIALRC